MAKTLGEFQALSRLRKGGKIKDTRILMDALGLMMQPGALPPP